MNAFDIVARVREISPLAANALLNRAIPLIIPLASGLRVKVVENTERRCVLTMPVFRRTRNHLHAMYFGAQMTLADLTVGVLLFQHYPPGPYGGVIKSVQADFRAKGKGLIRCICELPDEVHRTLEQVRDNDSGKVEAWVPLELRDGRDQLVTEVRFLVAIKRF